MEQIESLLQRPKFYNNIDGLGEMGLGFFGLGCGLLDWLQARNPTSAVWHGWMGMAWFWLIIAIIYYGTRLLKERITYPRTGFVEYSNRKTTRLVALVLGCIVGLLAATVLAHSSRSHWNIGGPHWGLTTPAALLGLAFAAAYAYGIARADHWKWAVTAVIAISAIVIAALPVRIVEAVAGGTSPTGTLSTSYAAWMLTISVFGAILLVSGGITFVLYMRHTQPPTRTAE